eukprot:2336721-Pyramimonas_sp.AAC.2
MGACGGVATAKKVVGTLLVGPGRVDVRHGSLVKVADVEASYAGFGVMFSAVSTTATLRLALRCWSQRGIDDNRREGSQMGNNSWRALRPGSGASMVPV